MGKRNGQPKPDFRPPPQNPHFSAGYGQAPPPAYQQHPQAAASPPQQHYQAQPQQPRGGQGGQRNPQTRNLARPTPPSEVSDCVKYSLFLYNIIFWGVGLLFAVAGIWALNDRGAFSQFTDNSGLGGFSFLTDPVLWLFFFGAVIFILGTMGCLGALRENICMLKTFSFVMGLILLLEIGGGIAIYFYREEIRAEVTEAVTERTIIDYRDNADFQDIIDAVQSGLSCCGGDTINDWDMNIYFNCSGPANNPERCGVPFSCCVVPDGDELAVVNTQCGYNARNPDNQGSIADKIFTTGCVSAFTNWFNTYLYYIAGVAGVVVLVELFGFCFAHSLINDIKRQKSRWAHR